MAVLRKLFLSKDLYRFQEIYRKGSFSQGCRLRRGAALAAMDSRKVFPRNLVINNQSRVPIVRSTCDIIRETIRFFRECPKRRSRLGVNIPLFSPTRWSEKYKSIRIFKANFKLIFDALASLMVGREQ